MRHRWRGRSPPRCALPVQLRDRLRTGSPRNVKLKCQPARTGSQFNQMRWNLFHAVIPVLLRTPWRSKSCAQSVTRATSDHPSPRDERCKLERRSLSSVIELAKVITPENATEVLPRFFGLSSGRRLRRRVHPPGRERSPARLPREAGAGRRRGRDDVERPSGGAGRPVRVARGSGARNARGGRSEGGGTKHIAAAMPQRPSGGEASRRGARPRQHDGLAPAPRQARRRLRRPLALAPGRVGGGRSSRSASTSSSSATRSAAGSARSRVKAARKPAAATAEAPPPAPPKRSRHVPAEVWRGVWKRDRRLLLVAARGRRSLRLHVPGRARSHRRVRARRGHHDRRVPAPLPRPPGRRSACTI